MLSGRDLEITLYLSYESVPRAKYTAQVYYISEHLPGAEKVQSFSWRCDFADSFLDAIEGLLISLGADL